MDLLTSIRCRAIVVATWHPWDRSCADRDADGTRVVLVRRIDEKEGPLALDMSSCEP